MTLSLSSLATALPVFFLAGLVYLLLRKGVTAGNAILFSAITWGTVVAVGTELLSFFKIINYEAITAFWLLSVGMIILAALFSSGSRSILHLPPLAPDKTSTYMLAGGISIVALTGLTAIIAPPNNFDSLTYHMARIIHWMQNQSVEHYPTNITRQLYSGPWAEYLLLHIQILSGTDRFANLLQWSAMLGTLLVVAKIVREIGGARQSSFYAWLLCASIPMGILQASSTQNDYVTTFWMTCFVWGSLLPRKRILGLESLATGCSLGLAILTKGTTYPLAFPFLVWMFLRDMGLTTVRALSSLLLVLSLVLAINCGHFHRNLQTFGNPISTGKDKLTNEAPGIRSMVLNMERFTLMQFATPSADSNRLIEKGDSQLARIIGADPDDSKNFLLPFKLRPFVQFHEDFAVNPLHTMLIVVSLLFVLTQRCLRREPLLYGYTLALLASFMLFSLLLKWQPFGNRLFLPLFVLWMPVSAIALSMIFRGRAAAPVVMTFLACSLPWLLFNTSRPLLQVPGLLISRLAPGIVPLRSILASDRIEQYYANKPEFRTSQERVAQILVNRGCRNVGLMVGNDYWEYSLWVLMQKHGEAAPKFEHLTAAYNSSKVQLNCQVISGNDNITYLVSKEH